MHWDARSSEKVRRRDLERICVRDDEVDVGARVGMATSGAATSSIPSSRAVALPGAHIPVSGRHRRRADATRLEPRTPSAVLLHKSAPPTSSHSGSLLSLQRRLSRLVAASWHATCAFPTVCRVRFSPSDYKRLLRVKRTMRAPRPIRGSRHRRCGRPRSLRMLNTAMRSVTA